MIGERRRRTERLLARGHLPGRAREELLARVLGDPAVTGKPVRRWGARIAVGLPAAFAVAAILLFVRSDRGDSDALREKGSSSAAPLVEIACTSREGEACHRGGKLLVRVEALPQGGFLEAYLTRVGPAAKDADGERLWISPPRADARTVSVPADRGPQILASALELASLEPGAYSVHLRLLRRELTRSELASAGDGLALATVHLPLAVIP